VSGRAAIPQTLLVEAVVAAREALRRLDADEVPAMLKRVAASSARRLPPPLLVSLLDYLDDSAWLRERAQEAWPDANPEDGDARRAVSALYLLRPDGWEELAQACIERVSDAEGARADEESRREVRRLKRVVRELESRMDSARSAAEAARHEAAAELQERIDRSDDLRHRADVARGEARAEVDRLHLEVSRLTAELAEADQRIDELRTRRARRDLARQGESGRGFGRGDGLSMAQDLDRMLQTMRIDGELR